MRCLRTRLNSSSKAQETKHSIIYTNLGDAMVLLAIILFYCNINKTKHRLGSEKYYMYKEFIKYSTWVIRVRCSNVTASQITAILEEW
mmetsp:Transcript_10/g.20  ORF Transcript_10/g.20 Transcript_10/m.20 type:complete len:88 (+) Transcript_10:198-461(+)